MNNLIREFAAMVLAAFLLTSCTTAFPPFISTAAAHTPTPFQPQTPIAPTASATEVVTTPTVEPQPSPLPSSTATEHPAGAVDIPILLYHHIAENATDHRYYVPPAMFEQQIQWLVDHGYHTITEAHLTEVIRAGGTLPERPVIITFDDGNEDFFTGAFSIMKNMNLVGVAFLVTDRIDLTGFISSDQVKELIAAGWEIGSHTITHPDLLRYSTHLTREVQGSRQWLNQKFGINVVSFAYPFGLMNASIAKFVENSEYTSAAGLGGRTHQSEADLYDLGRIEIRGYYTMDQFAALMPWQ